MLSGFANDDITPPLGANVIGTLIERPSKTILDPLSVNAVVFDDGIKQIGIIQLDILSIRWSQVNDIRRSIESEYGFPGQNVMICASHNHAGPAVSRAGWVQRDEGYIQYMIKKSVDTFGRALSSCKPCKIGHDSCLIFDLAYNRRIVLDDGTVKTNTTLKDPGAMYVEGPVDLSLSVICAQAADGSYIGAIVNFAIHPVHHSHESVFSAGFPGILARLLKEHGVPITLFLNGACGNVSGRNPHTGGITTKEEVGSKLAEQAWHIIQQMKFKLQMPINTESSNLQLSYRSVTRSDLDGSKPGTQRVGKLSCYDEIMRPLQNRIKERQFQPAEIQVHCIGNIALAGIPGEFFAENGLFIKEKTHPMHTWIVGYTNGMVGYLPHREAVNRGGYEATFTPWSRMAPESADKIADEIIRLIWKNSSIMSQK